MAIIYLRKVVVGEGMRKKFMKEDGLALSDNARSDLAEIVRRIVEAAEPEKVILFGSTARGEAGPHSDMDFLIIKSASNKRELDNRIRRALYGVNVSIDLVVASPEDVERYKDSHALVIKPALKDGIVVYDAA